MPVKQTGNWAPQLPSPATIDMGDYAPVLTTPLLMMQGGGRFSGGDATWWQNNTGSVGSFAWVTDFLVTDKGWLRAAQPAVPANDSGIGHRLPMVNLAQARPSAFGAGDHLPSIRLRVDMATKVQVFNGISAGGMRIGLTMAGSPDVVTEQGLRLQVNPVGIYDAAIDRINGADSINAIGGGLLATDPHMVSFEAIMGDVNRIRAFVRGELVYERSSSDGLYRTAVGGEIPINNPCALQLWRAGGPELFPVSEWRIYGTRVRLDYV